MLRSGPHSFTALAYGSGFGLPPAARVALTSAREAALRSACACDGVWLGDEALAPVLADALEEDVDVVAVERETSPERLVELQDDVP